MRSVLAKAALSVALLVPAAAGEIVIDVPEASVEAQTLSYACSSHVSLEVRYINAGDVSLAVFVVEDRTVVASASVAASGVRYVGGRYVWWTKGDAASLYDLMAGEDAAPLLDCIAAT